MGDKEPNIVTVNDLNAAKDAALQCVEAVRQICIFGKSSFGPRSPKKPKGALTAPAPAKESPPNPPTPRCDLTILRWMNPVIRASLNVMDQTGKTAIITCTTAAETLLPLYSDAVRNILTLANAGSPKAHDTALEAARRAYELLFVSEFPTVRQAYQTHLRKYADLSDTESLRKFLKELSGPSGQNYWLAVQAHAAKWDFKHKKHKEGVEREWAGAVRMLEKKNGDISGRWSLPATHKKWENRFGVKERTLRDWRDKGFRMEKAAGQRGMWRVHTKEPAYIEWDSKRTSLNE